MLSVRRAKVSAQSFGGHRGSRNLKSLCPPKLCADSRGSWGERISPARGLRLDSLLDRLDALARLDGVIGVRILQQHLVVINERPARFVVLFVELRGLEIAARLFGLERGNGFLRLADAGVIRVESQEIGEGRHGLSGGALVVFG